MQSGRTKRQAYESTPLGGVTVVAGMAPEMTEKSWLNLYREVPRCR